MGRRNDRGSSHGSAPRTFEFERTLAAAEEDSVKLEPEGSEGPERPAPTDADTCCTCGSNEFLLEAFVHIVDGRARPEFVELQTLSCPQCAKEFEAVQMEDGRVLRGEFVGLVDLDGDEDR